MKFNQKWWIVQLFPIIFRQTNGSTGPGSFKPPDRGNIPRCRGLGPLPKKGKLKPGKYGGNIYTNIVLHVFANCYTLNPGEMLVNQLGCRIRAPFLQQFKSYCFRIPPFFSWDWTAKCDTPRVNWLRFALLIVAVAKAPFININIIGGVIFGQRGGWIPASILIFGG